MENKQVLITADDRFGASGESQFKVLVVLGVAAVNHGGRGLEPDCGMRQSAEEPLAPLR